jgi:26S proteasome regulatory subunit N2
LVDTQPGEEKVLIEEKLKKVTVEKAAAPTTLEDMRNESLSSRREAQGQDEVAGSGAAAAAGVLTAVDEDEEGGEEADIPRDFEYFTDNEEE